MRIGLTTYTWGRDWDLPTLIANCQKTGLLGLELRTSMKYAHGVELEIGAGERHKVRTRFERSPVTLVGIATGERFDSPDPTKLRQGIENAKKYLELSRDIGSSGVRVFPNDFHKDVPRQKTIEQIAKSLNEVGAVAADLGQQVRLEAHGSAGELATLLAIMEQVDQPSVRVKLNSDARDAKGKGFESNFGLVKQYLGDTVHLHDLKDKRFPYQTQTNQLHAMGWKGWLLLELGGKLPDDRVAALTEYRKLFDGMLATARKSRPKTG